MKRVFVALLFSLPAIFYNKPVSAQSYFVKKVKHGAITVNGKGDSKAWETANTLTHFIYPWESIAPPSTSFAALWDDQWLYCLYRIQDDSINIYDINHIKREIGGSDRAEIFFKIDDKMTPYYCLEMDASGRILDYTADYYRQVHYEWQWPKDQLLVKTSKTKDGYIVEVAISISSLTSFGLLKDNRLQAGIFRAECTSIQNGKANLKWISWIDPKSPQPDFHIPAAFGVLQLE